MKIAIVCDWLVTYAGSERVLENIIACYPEADLFAVVDFMPANQRDFLLNKPIRTTFIQHLPFAKTHYRQYLPLMPLAIEQLDVTDYDLVISSSHAVAKGVITGPNQIHISYVHSPMRYAWDLQHQYLRESGLQQGLKGLIAKYCLHKMRLWDARTANGVDHFIANSQYVARRIQKTYRRDATVIYPPVNTLPLKPHQTEKENFYLAASRFVPYKRMGLIVDAFTNMPDKQLIVIGDGPDFEKVKKIANNSQNISLLGFQSTANLISYMQKAKAFIFAAEEDFGIIPVEAQACGTPVIAFGKGGALETIQDISTQQPTGLFFHEQSTSAILDAVNAFEVNQHLFTAEHCMANAAQFSSDHFRKTFQQFVNQFIKS